MVTGSMSGMLKRRVGYRDEEEESVRRMGGLCG
jgi:hypothetical protein